MVATIIIIVIVVLLAAWYISAYNGLIRTRTHVQESWSQIDVQLKRRNDLIPNLVSTTKGYANFEQSTLKKVVALRNQLTAVPDGDHQQTMEVSNQLSTTLRSLFALSENYPDLKANTQFTQLMEELTNTENKIAYSRQLYNSSVANLTMKIQSFPSNIVAKVHHFQENDYLQVPEEEKTAPKVNFDDFNQDK
ncbi:MAG: LemA family protein [Levilactobacillus sp.]|jgi:LemA protein|uniref:LemA family protein n=1 Tax=Levilactobacillus sp. TaxID=2767919 RepID=UPI00258502EA|nr:LemA family protein [Levilactobacillus sp.]MCH4124230.1 LemA family protein [Levilactobacillus sp.]MCI1554484.1 LemA family protein [Levilactobacillus sp.]MCI1598326.1 LemA family protein [Levilactobacillus sp.]MCI1605606.1 LemA family protein [Levilactobacillus sp.]